MVTTHTEGPIGHLVIDVPGRSMNVLDPELAHALDEALTRLVDDEAVRGIVISSGKSSFVAGADLARMSDFVKPGVSQADALGLIGLYNRLLRRIETCGKPVVAAASGTALGGGLELMLCAHYRIATDDPKARFGLPEVGLGLLPGAGGTQRLPRLIGIAASLPLLTQGTSLDARAALKLGILNEVVPAGELIQAASRALLEGRVKAIAPWDEKGFRLPGGDAYSRVNSDALMAANASLHAATKGNYPAPQAILRAVYEGTRLPIDKGLKLEQQLFVKLVQGAVAQNMIRTLFFARQAADKLSRRPAGIAKQSVRRLGIVGAGFMGAGIAQVSAAAGIDVVLLDRDLATAGRGRDSIAKALQAEVDKGRLREAVRDQILSRIEVAADHSAFGNCDLVIEAVLEDFEVKASVTRATEAALPAHAIFASNTSALPINELASASARPQNFIGLHFFSPVSRMALVEVIVGSATSDETLARSLDYIQQIHKTPIVVRDGYGFYTTRCVEAYIREGVRLLADGVNPVLIENAGTALGMPVGPLTLADEVGIDVLHHIVSLFRDREHGRWADDKHGAGNAILGRLELAGRFGRKAGRGFFAYPPGEPRHLELGDLDLSVAADQPEVGQVKERLLYAQVLEAARCWTDGVIDDAREADLGAHLGWAFPSWLGGPLAFIDTVGITNFVQRSDELVARYGPRFEVPGRLREAAAGGQRFHAVAA
ncbi:enoyl-CoA hydratase/isomerase family protein [Paraburkholderia xenovorans LB400]|uniref:enoyl-CoA hydratase n=1 Tax=Paraburkholderia xenovorans (strain LB400) TaxID=266265 RepID=Q13I86_PARXL|nr:3-hydroxyacyl-CoA dehydrogenase NAD-binding domain-containing protein [Paraburkholderia xenovorans]ABE36203.1 3-hydroxyacyl-CoA dehydrogenase [Paraburkholderia xenovorans LB400]AIP34089.1 enoyl-CoA hydratase/isomerase family protein [Paraburkholderia xenovorans LB400]